MGRRAREGNNNNAEADADADSNNNNTTTTTRIPLTQKLYIIASSPMDTVH